MAEVTSVSRILLVIAGVGAIAIGGCAVWLALSTGTADLISAVAYLLAGVAIVWVALVAKSEILRSVVGRHQWQLVLGGALAIPSALLLLAAAAIHLELARAIFWATVITLAVGMAILFFDLP
ncbi:MAG: hypothetical protein QM784_22705 [Polyangiaceae bacterium]